MQVTRFTGAKSGSHSSPTSPISTFSVKAKELVNSAQKQNMSGAKLHAHANNLVLETIETMNKTIPIFFPLPHSMHLATYLENFKNVLQETGLSQEIQKRQSQFDTQADGQYPFLDANNNPLKVVSIVGAQTDSNTMVDSVKPFISNNKTDAEGNRHPITNEERAQLYSKNMTCRPITEDDISTGEDNLVGQNGVFAARSIPEGTCLGVYPSHIIANDFKDETDYQNLEDIFIGCRRYIIPFVPALADTGSVTVFSHKKMDAQKALSSNKVEKFDAYMDGTGTMSRLNTVCDGGDTSKLNVEPRYFHTWVEVPENFPGKNAKYMLATIPAFFATRDINENEEMRFKYNISDKNKQVASQLQTSTAI